MANLGRTLAGCQRAQAEGARPPVRAGPGAHPNRPL